MSKLVRLTKLVQRVNDEGQTVLSGFIGMAEIIGFQAKPTQNGSDTWIIYLANPDQRAQERRRNAYHDRKRNDGVVQLGGFDG